MLGGRTHVLLLDLNAMVAFEEKMKVNFLIYTQNAAILEAEAEVERKIAKREHRAPTKQGYVPTMLELRTLIWCQLLHENDPEVDTPEKVGGLISIDELGKLLGATREATKNASPVPKEGDVPNLTADPPTG